MNPKTIFLIFSFRKELTYVFVTFLFILLLPFIAVFVVTHTGISVVAGKLASVNLQTRKVDIHDSLGKVVASINVSTLWPVHGVVTLGFGESDLPYQPFHTGIDIAGKIGDPVTPFMKGTVIYADEISWGYGKHIIIDNGNSVESLYGHLSAMYVKKGDEVKPGDIIGAEGSTGWSTGPHVHFEIDVYGIPVNPRTFVLGNP